MNLILWTILFFVICNSMQIHTLTMILTCRTYTDYFSDRATLNECSSENLKILQQNETVDEFVNTRLTLRFNAKRVTLSISSSAVYYIPLGLEAQFKNLTSLSIKFSKLREIHQYNLEPFTELTYLSLIGNDLQVIEQDLFKFNTKLMDISLEHNHIQHVEPNVFSELKELRNIYFNFNPCVMHTNYDHWMKVNITSEIYENCKPRVDDSSDWKASEEPREDAYDKSCSCSGLLVFTVIFGLVLITLPVLVAVYFYKIRRMSLMEMKESLVQFSAINDHL